MSIKTNISDSSTGITATVVNGVEEHALVVATRPLKTVINSLRFFSNPNYGADMNQNAEASGTPIMIHDGTDNVYWTASDIVGGVKTTFNSIDQNHTPAGTKSIRVDNSPVNDVFQLDGGTPIDLNLYVALTIWIYVEKDWVSDDSIIIYGWDTITSSQVGIQVGLENYFDYLNYNVWQKIKISLTDMELLGTTSLDSLRFVISSRGIKGPKFYLDDIRFEEIGDAIPYSIKADVGTWLYVKEFNITIVDNVSSIITDATMPYIPYDKFLSVSPTIGITYKRTISGKVEFSYQIIKFIDLIGLAGANVTGYGTDGVNSWVTVRIIHNEPLLLKEEHDDDIVFSINDDMSDLLHFRVNAGCIIEEREMYKG